ncbi:hypothetical protein Bca101_090669 [Brassica carinata]
MCGSSGRVEWRGFGSGVRSGLWLRDLSLFLALSACSSRLGEGISLAEGVMDPLDGGAAVLLPLVSVVSNIVLFGPVNLPLRGLLELLLFPSQNGLRRVLRRGGVCE